MKAKGQNDWQVILNRVMSQGTARRTVAMGTVRSAGNTACRLRKRYAGYPLVIRAEGCRVVIERRVA